MTSPVKVVMLPRRRRRSVATPLFPAEVLVFPLVRQSGAVAKVARHMRSLSTLDQRHRFMTDWAERTWAEFCARGAEGVSLEDAMIEFIGEVGLEVEGGPRGGVAWRR